ncbi:MAG: hypothetical protein ABIA76_00395 [Candidatus Diapherotrites archaeon]
MMAETEKNENEKNISLKVIVSRQESLTKINEFVSSFGWSSFSFSGLQRLELILVPFYFFHFDAFKTQSVEGKEKVIDETSGKLALDAVKNEFNSNFSKFFGSHKVIEEQPVSAERDAKIIFPSVAFDKAEEVIKVKLASRFKLGKENIVVSGLKLVFIPFYVSQINLNEEKYELKINAFTGETTCDKSIPVRPKEFNEIVSETMHELSDPLSWGEYAFDSIETLADEKTGLTIKLGTLLVGLAILVLILVLIGFI